MSRAKSPIAEGIDDRVKLIKKAIKKRCSTLNVMSEKQHIIITGASDRLTRKERIALRELGIPHSTFHAKVYKESDEYQNLLKHLVELGLTSAENH
jgi:hypothetical protein